MRRDKLFWSYVEIRGPDDCWQWIGYRDKDGYGKVHRGYETFSASKYALAQAVGWDRNRHALHRCDNPSCCNPAHLRWGTPKENSNDKVGRGRQRNGAMPGFSNPRCKLKPEQLGEIVTRLKAGESNTQIANDMPVSHHLISRIRRGTSWLQETQKMGWKP